MLIKFSELINRIHVYRAVNRVESNRIFDCRTWLKFNSSWARARSNRWTSFEMCLDSTRQMDMWLEIELDPFVGLPEVDSFITNESRLHELVQINLNKNL